MSNYRSVSFCSGLLSVGLMLAAWNTASAVSVYYLMEGEMIDNDQSHVVGFVAGSAFSAVFKYDDEDYLQTGGDFQHEYLRGVLPGQEGPDPRDAVPSNGPDGVGLVSVGFDLDNNGVVETTHLRTSTGDNNTDTIDDGAPTSAGRVQMKENLIGGGADWFKWIGSAFSRDVAVLGVPGPGWIDLYPVGGDLLPPTNAQMTGMLTQLFNNGGLGVLIGVGGGGTFFGDPGGVVTSFSVIPEPTSLVLLGLGASLCLARRQRR